MATSRSCSGGAERRVHFDATFPSGAHYPGQETKLGSHHHEADYPGLPGTYPARCRCQRVCGGAVGPNVPPGAAPPPPARGANGKARPETLRTGLFDSGAAGRVGDELRRLRRRSGFQRNATGTCRRGDGNATPWRQGCATCAPLARHLRDGCAPPRRQWCAAGAQWPVVVVRKSGGGEPASWK